MSWDRVPRSRKQVDYSKFGGGDDDDDDFADSTPPPAKKAKKDKLALKKEKDKKEKKKSESKTDYSNQPKVSVERSSGDRNVFDLDLEKALEMSRQEVVVHVEPPGHVSAEDPGITAAVATSTPLDKENNPLVNTEINHPPKTTSAKEKRVSAETFPDLDVIEIIEEDVQEPSKSGRARRVASKPKKKYIDDSDDSDNGGSDDDFQVDVTGEPSDDDDESEDDFNPDEDSDYDDGPKKKKKGKQEPAKSTKAPTAKAQPAKKTTPAVSRTKSKTSRASPVTPSMPSLSKVTPISQRKALASTPHSMPKLNKSTPLPPARKSALSAASGKSPGLGGIVIKSPGSATCGIVRQGLSRRANIKPLHSNVKTQ